MTDRTTRSTARRRTALVALAVAVLVAGLLVHRFGSGDIGDIAGDALYAVLVYLLFAIVLTRSARSLPAALAIIFCTAVEFLQLTELPRTWALAFPPSALVLGSGFAQRDLLVYPASVLLAMIVDVAVSRRARRRRR
ncbi:ribosomal maturation YjgA family protein [Microbacterium shaanxiense]